jgi:hypothetical protein
MAALQRARAHGRLDDALVSVQPLRDRVANFADLIDINPNDPSSTRRGETN